MGGVPPGPVRPRSWDLPQRAAAAQLDQREPAWFISYGVGSRRFLAIASWHTSPLLVEATTVHELRELMRDAELEAALSPARVPVRAR
ncbi:hypothetical protein [Sphaerisporangium rhizosphaerae]|uniref:MmcQ/YjbR family DNA-binding protein n=1 Tax=Sphaerisporangium rhizosphaerae TaxID=2269375 RepID=A0ABW2P1C4_9ACTN